MTRHEGVATAADDGQIVLGCKCGWTEGLGRSPAMLECLNAFGRHHHELRGPPQHGAHLMFGWDEDGNDDLG